MKYVMVSINDNHWLNVPDNKTYYPKNFINKEIFPLKKIDEKIETLLVKKNRDTGSIEECHIGKTYDFQDKDNKVEFKFEIKEENTRCFPRYEGYSTGWHRGDLDFHEYMFDFKIIKNSEIRKIVSEDWSEAKKAYSAGLHKSTVVLCGAILEALLRDSLERVNKEIRNEKYIECQKENQNEFKSEKIPELHRWHFEDLIKVSNKLGHITNNACRKSFEIKNFRNLIHIHKQNYQGLSADKSISLITLELLTMVYDDINR